MDDKKPWFLQPVNGLPCFHCGHNAVTWDADFMADEYGYDFEGIVHSCHCTHCGAEVIYIVNLAEQGGEGDG